MPRPNLLDAFSWEDFEEFVLSVFEVALIKLRVHAGNLSKETRLNQDLLQQAERVNWQRNRRGDGFPICIFLNAANQPEPDDESDAPRLDKIPDVHCALFNHTAPTPQAAMVLYVIECKRLGKPERSSWIFNENYTSHGIVRFRDSSHAYAKGCVSAAMIGYVQSMDLKDVLRDVNSVARAAGFPKILPPKKWNAGRVMRLGHQTFHRSFPVDPFTLHHLWADLR
jgi:hypothetical protein